MIVAILRKLTRIFTPKRVRFTFANTQRTRSIHPVRVAIHPMGNRSFVPVVFTQPKKRHGMIFAHDGNGQSLTRKPLTISPIESNTRTLAGTKIRHAASLVPALGCERRA